MADSRATPTAKKKQRLIVLQPGRGKRDPNATRARVMCSDKRGGYYNHRRIAKGDIFDFYFIGDIADLGVPDKGASWVVLAESDAAADVLAEVAADKEEAKKTRTRMPSDVAPRTRLTGPDPDDDEGRDGGGKATGPIGDEEAEEETVI